MRIRSKKLRHVEKLFESLPKHLRTVSVLRFGMNAAKIPKATVAERLHLAEMMNPEKEHKKKSGAKRRAERESEEFDADEDFA
jgi:hypothetical protein